METPQNITGKSTSASRTYARGALARKRILDAAIDEFGRRGYWGAVLQEIADRVEISKAGLMHHFPSKKALLSAVIRQVDEQDMQRENEIDLRSMRGLEVFDALDQLIERNSERRPLIQLAHVLRAEASGSDHPLSDEGSHHFETARQVISSALYAGIEDGTVRADTDVNLTALLAVATMEGLENQWLSDPEAVDLVGSYHAFTQRLREDLSF